MGRQRVGALAGHVVRTGPAPRMDIVGRLLEIARCAVRLTVEVMMPGTFFIDEIGLDAKTTNR